MTWMAILYLVLCASLHGCTTEIPKGSVKSIHCSHRVSTTDGSWELSLDASGGAELMNWTRQGKTNRSFKVSAATISEIEDVIRKQQFFDLPEDLGRPVIDGSSRTMAVTCVVGEKTKVKTIVIHDWPLQESEEDAIRAIEVWRAIRSAFAVNGAVDGHPVD